MKQKQLQMKQKMMNLIEDISTYTLYIYIIYIYNIYIYNIYI